MRASWRSLSLACAGKDGYVPNPIQVAFQRRPQGSQLRAFHLRVNHSFHKASSASRLLSWIISPEGDHALLLNMR